MTRKVLKFGMTVKAERFGTGRYKRSQTVNGTRISNWDVATDNK